MSEKAEAVKQQKNHKGNTKEMKSLFSLFLSQAYQDCWDDYKRSLKSNKFLNWYYVILTASNEHQAEAFQKQLEERRDYLPSATKFVNKPGVRYQKLHELFSDK